MKGWRKILVAVVVVWVAAMSPRLIEAWHKKKDMDHVFSEFTKMPWPLNDGNDAYAFSGDEFRAATSAREFARQEEELGARFGKLRIVSQGQTVVDGRGTPPRQ